MATDTWWNGMSEMRLLAHFASESNTPFALRGSVASVLATLYRRRAAPPPDLVRVIPPFSDLDFVVDECGQAFAVSGALGTAIPRSPFVRADVRTRKALARYVGANIRFTRTPEIHFGQRSKDPAHVSLLWTGEDLDVEVGEEFGREPGIERGKKLDAENAFIDIIYTARRHPQLLSSESLQELRAAVERMSSDEFLHSLSGDRLRRAIFSLAKLILSYGAGHDIPDPEEWMGEQVWDTLLKHENPAIRRAARLLRRGVRRQNVVVTAVPRRRGGTWQSRVELIAPTFATEQEPMHFREDEADPEVSIIGVRARMPAVVVKTDWPERPGCCRYHDFSRGVLEIGWSGPSTPPAPLDDTFTFVAAGPEFFVAPSLSSTMDGEHAARLDYGYLCQIAGRARNIEILHAGADDAK